MALWKQCSFVPVWLAILGLTHVDAAPPSDRDVDFNRDIRPILSDNCFQCHGSDKAKRKADLRLDVRDGLFADRDGQPVIVPGNVKKSELFRRIAHDDGDERMPPVDSGRKLTRQQIDVIRRWIEQGAAWQQHWAYVPPTRPPLPSVDDRAWPRNAIDYFILARLQREKLHPSPATDKARLIRRATLDLTGLPPTPSEIDAFLRDRSPAAYERVVDRLLASPRYGERMAMPWLDAARYADTDGYQDDEPRVMWRWRDWLIDALNENTPYDRFTIEQLAGDLLPHATPEQKLATGFNRNNRTNGEGGSIAEEFRVEYAMDRVNTIATVWLGLTLGCARCHDHKYDPLSQKEFYGLFAFFNNVPERGTYRRNSAPLITVPPRLVQLQIDRIEQRLAALDEKSKQHQTLKQERERLLKSVPTTMILQEGSPRTTYVLIRGRYNKPGEKVTAAVPEIFPPLPNGAPVNRLGLAKWIVDPSQPLTARVAVNRFWQTFFGTGLVKTAEDFGSQGERPSHPRLLDWLATEFIRKGWDVKAMRKLIVTSATYRQSSKISQSVYERDPENRLLARGPRLRLSAETIRDQALAVGGLLIESIGGPSVKPYQPAGLWKEIAGGASGAYRNGYQADRGANLYRRSMYTFWRRTIPPPSMAAFDAPSRETCIVRRGRTNTPLQALALMNEMTYVEAARALAQRIMREHNTAPDHRISRAFRIATARYPRPDELQILISGLNRYLDRFRRDQKSAQMLLSVGQSQPDANLDASELAAYTAISNVILNLDETLTKE